MPQSSLEKIWSRRENLERILDNLKEGIIAHDLKRRIFFFNREAEKITGYSRRDVLGRDCHQAFGSPFCGERCAFCENAPPPTEEEEYTVNITTRGGEYRRVELTQILMRGEGEEVLGVLASIRDVTDLLRLRMRAGKLTSFANIIGRDIKMLQVFQQISDVSGYDYPVHISGETGTGKELVATAIHNESRRGGAPFVPINCGALPEGLIESELFGHVKGAFSGAIRDKKGRFELADGGTIFLDEVAELSKQMQVKLLRFLQEGTFERVGGEKTIGVQVRIISATNKDLKKEVQRGAFRDDLFYRLNVIPIHIPPLRERKNDIPLLIDHFVIEAGERYGEKHLRLTREALSVMMDYSWPGNVRELQNAIQFAIVKSSGDTITTEDLPLELRGYRNHCLKPGVPRKLDAETVRAALTRTGGNKAKAARLLNVGRATLYRFLADFPGTAGDA
jgi:PAS domain S-box-containing protein